MITSSDYFKTNNSTLNRTKYKWFLNITIWPMDETLTDPRSSLYQSGPRSNDNEEVLQSPHYQMRFSVIHKIPHFGRGLNPLPGIQRVLRLADGSFRRCIDNFQSVTIGNHNFLVSRNFDTSHKTNPNKEDFRRAKLWRKKNSNIKTKTDE